MSTAVSTIRKKRLPSLITRRAETDVELRDGQSFSVAGLLQNETNLKQDQLPWLGDVPILGSLFKSSSFQKRDTELVVIVTPRLVKPLAADAPQPQMPGESWRSYDPGSGKLFWQGADSPYRDSPVGFSR